MRHTQFDDYSKCIAAPMDLTLLRARLASGWYRSIAALLDDVDLLAINTAIYTYAG
jgi:hypothetical protein